MLDARLRTEFSMMCSTSVDDFLTLLPFYEQPSVREVLVHVNTDFQRQKTTSSKITSRAVILSSSQPITMSRLLFRVKRPTRGRHVLSTSLNAATERKVIDLEQKLHNRQRRSSSDEEKYISCRIPLSPPYRECTRQHITN